MRQSKKIPRTCGECDFLIYSETEKSLVCPLNVIRLHVDKDSRYVFCPLKNKLELLFNKEKGNETVDKRADSKRGDGMSYIVPRDIPKNCRECPCGWAFWDECSVLARDYEKDADYVRPDWCPLVEVREPKRKEEE